jgi:class 3 adenylate cyclase
MKIRYKLLLVLMALGATCVLVSGYVGDKAAERSLTETVMRQLTGVRRAKAQQIESYFHTLSSHVRTLSEDRMLIDATMQFKDAYKKLDAQRLSPELRASIQSYYSQEYLPALKKFVPLRPNVSYLPVGNGPFYVQQHYIVENPFPISRKKELDAAADASEYSRVHAKFHRSFRNIVDSFGYYDLFLVDHETGDILYTVDKEPDFGTSLTRGPYRNTGLARIFKQAAATEDPDSVFIADFEDFEPSLGAPAAFIACPIMDGPKRVGVLGFQLSNAEFDKVTSGNRGWAREGLGTSGDSGIVGADFLLRSNARGFLEHRERHLALMRARGVPEQTIERIKAYNSTFLRQEVKLPSVTRALAGEEGTMIQKGSSGGLSLVAFGPLNIPGLHWTLASRMDYSEALEPAKRLRRQLLAWAAALLAFTAVISLLLTRAIVRPVNALADAAVKLGAGDLTAQVPVRSKDELGVLSSTFNSMVTNIREKTLIIEQKNRENEELLLNILPAPIAERLKSGETRIADSFAEVTVLFADIVGFTALSGKTAPGELLEMLNDLFTRFDHAASRHGIEKIKTIGDAYMAVCGLPVDYPDHSRRMIDMALEMIEECRKHSRENGRDINIRIGVNAGPVVAGVIGKTKYIYDLWGDTVNLASRMESHGVPGSIQVTRRVFEALNGEYEFEFRGEVEVKGKGKIETWLVGQKANRLVQPARA